jgi:hypothetical protein
MAPNHSNQELVPVAIDVSKHFFDVLIKRPNRAQKFYRFKTHTITIAGNYIDSRRKKQVRHDYLSLLRQRVCPICLAMLCILLPISQG